MQFASSVICQSNEARVTPRVILWKLEFVDSDTTQAQTITDECTPQDQAAVERVTTAEDELHEDKEPAANRCADTVSLLDNDVATFVGKATSLSRVEKHTCMKNVFVPEECFIFPPKEYHDKEGQVIKRRSFNHSWLAKYPGLAYSKTEDSAYCLYCVLFAKDTTDRLLVNRPVRDWKKATDIFNNHFFNKRSGTSRRAGGYETHQTCRCLALELQRVVANTQISVDSIINERLASTIQENSKALESIIDTIILCGRQGLPLRGHRDDSAYFDNPNNNPGNFIELLRMRMRSGDANLRRHFEKANKNATYRSKTTQRELINIIGEQIREKVINQCRMKKFFSVIADELQDCSVTEQLSLTVRYCMEEGGNMAGTTKGAGPRIEKDFPKAPYFWCASHQLNRVVVVPCQLPMVRNMMGTTDKVVSFFNISSKRNKCLKEIIDGDYSDTVPDDPQGWMDEEERQEEKEKKRMNGSYKLKDLCQTRWVERHDAFEVFIQLYPKIVETLTHMATSDVFRGDTATEAVGLLASITKYEFIISLNVVAHLLGYLKGISANLQGRQQDLASGFQQVKLVEERLRQIRNEEIVTKHNEMYNVSNQMSEAEGTVPAKPRTCGIQRHRSNALPKPTTDEVETSNYNEIEQYYRVNLTIPFLDHLLKEFSSR
ncbi:52 kDa repressor of the inhibitor of the protein kinase [Holothuria leucospilota]|uniref:52 kDa repressor of the inhibitor of the protein kinase n=1 Tax=Holothuria leucospilota TaxID=206669 RepID=A0A9Q1C467_HOLLE|nr:52 kDa repressor of the inhibitor of the protein kinase [Holothuria leucospilota]